MFQNSFGFIGLSLLLTAIWCQISSASKDFNLEIKIDLNGGADNNSGNKSNKNLIKLILKTSFNDPGKKCAENKTEEKLITTNEGILESLEKSVRTMEIKKNNDNNNNNETLVHETTEIPVTNDPAPEANVNTLCSNNTSCSPMTVEPTIVNETTTPSTEPYTTTGFLRPVLKCTDDFEMINNNCYFISKAKTTWNLAYKECMQKNSTLASISNTDDLHVLIDLIEKTHESDIWVGATYSSLKGEWYWTDGSPFNYDVYWNCDKNANFELGNGYCLTLSRREPLESSCNINNYCQDEFVYVCKRATSVN